MGHVCRIGSGEEPSMSKCEGLDWVKIQVYLSVKIQVNGSAHSCEGLDRVSI